MLDFIENLWNTKRWLFWILLPIAILWFCKKIVVVFLTHQFKKELQNAKNTDKKLNEEIDSLEKDISKKEGRIEEIDDGIRDRDADGGNLDWHKHYTE
jgi:anionic cell wall polymer biosynthesis LytR-Cps2A-Psr (LCP) family protein